MPLAPREESLKRSPIHEVPTYPCFWCRARGVRGLPRRPGRACSLGSGLGRRRILCRAAASHRDGYPARRGRAPRAHQHQLAVGGRAARPERHRRQEADCRQRRHQRAGQQRAFRRLGHGARPERLACQRQQPGAVHPLHTGLLPGRHAAAAPGLPHQGHRPGGDPAGPAGHAVRRRQPGRHHPVRVQPAQAGQDRSAPQYFVLPDAKRRVVQRHRCGGEPAPGPEPGAARLAGPPGREGLHRPPVQPAVAHGHLGLVDQARCQQEPLRGRRLAEGGHGPRGPALAPEARLGTDLHARRAEAARPWHERGQRDAREYRQRKDCCRD